MRYKDLVGEVWEKSSDLRSRNAAQRTVDLVISVFKEALLAGDDVKLPKFGRLQPRTAKKRTVMSPLIPGGGSVEVPERKLVKFDAYKGLKEGLNSGGGE